MSQKKKKVHKVVVTEPAALELVAYSPEPVSAPEPEGTLCRSTRIGTFVTGPVTWGPLESKRLSDAELADRRVQRALATGQLVRA